MLKRRQARGSGGQGMSTGMQAGGLRQATTAANQRIGTRFIMKQRLISFGDDFFIKNDQGEKCFKVDGKLLRLRDTLDFEDMQGRQLYKIQAKIVDIRETMTIKRSDGSKAAVVHNAWVSPIRDRWKIDIPGGQDLTAKGNILQHEYTIYQGGRLPIAVVSKKWLRIRDSYGVEVQSAFDAPLVLAITVVIDMMSHNQTMNKTLGGISKGSGLDIL